MRLEPYWEATRRVYAPFESGLPSPTGRVYTHEIPGGQLSNLRQQAIALGLGEKFEQIEDMYAAANAILGNIVKVTPSSKVVGDLALHLVAVGRTRPSSRRSRASSTCPTPSSASSTATSATRPAAGRSRSAARPWRAAPPSRVAAELDAEQRQGLAEDRRDTLNELLFPGPTREFRESREKYGDISVLPTIDYLYGLRARRGARGRPAGGQAAASWACRRSASPTSGASARCCARSTATSGR